MFKYTPQDKIKTEFINTTPFKSLHTLESSSLKSLQPLSLNALCALLEHQYMFSTFVIVMHVLIMHIYIYIYIYISLIVLTFKSGFQNHSHYWKGFKYAEDTGKPKNVQELDDFSLYL